MKRLVLALSMICLLSASAIGGEIPSVPVAPPPDEISTTSPGDVPTVGSAVTSEVLNLLQTVFGLI